MISKLALALLLLAASGSDAPVPAPKAGSFGFNWLDANSQCKELTAKDVAKLSKCEATDNAFGLDSKSLMCKVDARTELVIYPTAEKCQEALETMQANGD